MSRLLPEQSLSWALQCPGTRHMQGNGMGIACTGGVGISLCPGPPYFVMLTKQWAAVSSHFALMRVPPQTWTDTGGFQMQRILAIPAQAPDPGMTSVPPTTRDELRVVPMGRSPQVCL